MPRIERHAHNLHSQCLLTRDSRLENFTELLELQTFDLYTQGNLDIVIMWDTNIDLMKRNSNTKKYEDCLHTLQLQQIIQHPTRLTDRTSTLIDHISVNRTEMYYTSGTLELGISDHSLIYTARKKYKEDSEPTTYGLAVIENMTKMNLGGKLN